MNKFTKIVSIVSGKGGTGKSIISASIAYILAHCGFKTLLVDMDLFTHGLTFYALAEYPRDSSFFTADLFKHDETVVGFKPILIPEPFTDNNLSIAPSIKRTGRPKAELELSDRYRNVENFLRKTKDFFDYLVDALEFHYIIVDTRGGTDITSVSSCLAAGSYIIVTEADKPSWDMGRLLIDTIDRSQSDTSTETDRLGFIINKNVLPSEAIEAFLRKEWQATHLSTIPLDETAVRYFQEDSVPVSKDISCPFSYEILKVVHKSFVSELWKNDNLRKLDKLFMKAKVAIEEKKALERKENIANKMSFLMKLYGTILSTSLLAYLAFTIVRDPSEKSFGLTLSTVLIATMLIFFMTASDPRFLERIMNILFKKDTKSDDDDLNQ